MNIDSTREYYARLPLSELCQCDYCRNYMKEIRNGYPEADRYLQKIGIDIAKPFEAMPLEPDDKGNIEYIAVQYIVLGSKDDFVATRVAGVNIDLAESHPNTELEEEHFVLEISPILLKWTVS